MTNPTPTPHDLTAALVAVPGIRGIFPNHRIAALAQTFVTDHRERTTALVDLTTTATTATVHARIAIDHTATTSQILRAVYTELARLLPNRSLELHIEIAYIH